MYRYSTIGGYSVRRDQQLSECVDDAGELTSP